MSSKDDVSRSNLPIPDIQHSGLITYDAKDPDTRFPPIRDVRPPRGAPNVLVILIDDVGYGATSAFGGPCQTPNFEKLATGGLKSTRFHTTALVLADATGAAHRPKSSLGRHGRHHRDRDRQRQVTARCCPTPRRRSRSRSSSMATRRRSSASATKCPSGRLAPRGRSTHGRPVAAASSTSTASSAARTTSGTRLSMRARRQSSRRRRPPRAITSPKTSPTRRLPGRGSRRRSCPTSRSSCTSRRAPRTRRITCRRIGSTSTKASSRTAGTSSARSRSTSRRRWASSAPTPS